MRTIFKPYSLLSHLLSLILFFFIGLLFAKWTEAGKGQMLAAGAIVLSYGIVGGFSGLCLSVFVSSRWDKKNMIRLNLINMILILGLWGYFYNAYQKRKKEKDEDIQNSKRTSTPKADKETALLFKERPFKHEHLTMVC